MGGCPIEEHMYFSNMKIDWQKVTRSVLLSRELDRLEIEQLAPQGKIKYQFAAGGHELSQVLLAQALDHRHDCACVYYRCRALALASGMTPLELLVTDMARKGGINDGRDGGVIFNKPGAGGLTILPSSGDVGTQYTPAVGWAQAIHYRQNVLHEADWQGAVAVAMGGDGSVATNGFWAALNVATTTNLPVLFFIENNSFGISTPSTLQTPGGNIAANLRSFGNLKVMDADGCQPETAWKAISEAVAHVRSGAGPCLVHMDVVRLAGHTIIDDQAYKSTELRARESERDPLKQLHQFMLSQGLAQAEWDDFLADVTSEIDRARQQAETTPEPDPALVTSHMFYEGTPPQQGGLRSEKSMIEIKATAPRVDGARVNMIDAIRQTLESEMAINPRMLIFGEDVGVKGGVHGATRDMQIHLGAERVFDTSLSEEGIIGRAIGMALAGLLPVPEIQYSKYIDPAYEQIHDLGWLRWRTANRFAAPVVVRIPVGFGKHTGDPWHCVSGEGSFSHLLGWQIAYPSNAQDAAGLLRSALRGDDPTLFLEHRALLDASDSRRPYPGNDYCLPFGCAAQVTTGNELTIITWGAMVSRCLEAARDFPGRVAIIDLRTIIPWDQPMVLDSVHQTGKVLVVHEDTITAGFAGEIISVIANRAFSDLDAPIERLAMADIPIPHSISLMNSVLPGAASIRTKIQDLLDY